MRAVGWIGVTATGEPYRSVTSKGNRHQRTQPLKVYRSEANAKAQTGCEFAAEVFIDE